MLFVTSLSFVIFHKSIFYCLSQVCLLLFVVSLSFVVCRKFVVVVVCCKYIYYCCLSLFYMVLNYEVFRNCNEGARTRALMKLIISCPPPPFVSLVFEINFWWCS